MNEKDYVYFREVAKCLNYTKAAENLYISQPALTKRIGDIERKLGITLFYRTKHSVTLTPAGRIFAGWISKDYHQLSKPDGQSKAGK